MDWQYVNFGNRSEEIEISDFDPHRALASIEDYRGDETKNEQNDNDLRFEQLVNVDVGNESEKREMTGLRIEAEAKEDKVLWPKEEAKWLLEQYNLHENEIGRMKKFGTKKDLYSHLSLEIEIRFKRPKTVQQISNRVQTILRHRKMYYNPAAVCSSIGISSNASKFTGPPILRVGTFNAGSSFVKPSNVRSTVSATIGRYTGVVKPLPNTENVTPTTSPSVSGFSYAPRGVVTPTTISSTSNSVSTTSSVATGGSFIIDRFPIVDRYTIISANSPRTLSETFRHEVSTVSTKTPDIISGLSTANLPSVADLPNVRDLSNLEALRNDRDLPNDLQSNVLESIDTGGQKNISKSASQNIGQSQCGETRHTANWTTAESIFLLDQYELFMDEIGPMRYFRNKKELWQFVTKKINSRFNTNKTVEQVSRRYETIIQKKKDAVNNNMKSGGVRKHIEFEDELKKITANDDSIEPEVLRGVDFVKYKDKSNANTDPKKPRWGNPTKKGIAASINDTMMQMANRREERDTEKEQQRNERHKSVMDVLNAFLSK